VVKVNNREDSFILDSNKKPFIHNFEQEKPQKSTRDNLLKKLRDKRESKNSESSDKAREKDLGNKPDIENSLKFLDTKLMMYKNRDITEETPTTPKRESIDLPNNKRNSINPYRVSESFLYKDDDNEFKDFDL